ncbi:MAG: outer membrane lipoprotein-sorting protein [candidate division KSB1 bacterium]|nr:outer membrane lipoprotein-sorting protein [candidate division KSB1 bacterium]
MKYILSTLLVISILPLQAQNMSADSIIHRVNDLINQNSSQAEVSMTISTSSGDKRTFEYNMYTKNQGEKTLIEYTAPRRIQGQKMLMLNHADDIWLYFTRTRRVRKLASHARKQNFRGSDFTHEDMGGSNAFIDDFDAEKLPDEEKRDMDCYKLRLTRKPGAGSGYAKLVMWVNKDNMMPVVIDYYDKDNPDRIAKTLKQYDIKTIDDIPTPTRMVMINHNDDSKTVMQMHGIEYNIKLDNTLFTERGLKR